MGAQAEPDWQALKPRLKNGELVIEGRSPSRGNGVAFVAYKRLKVSPGHVWPVVRDCQHYKLFMPRTSASDRSDCVEQTCVCHSRVKLPFPLPDLWSRVRTTMTRLRTGGFQRAWTLLEGNYAHNQGSWRVLPWPGDQRWTLLVYTVDFNPHISLPDFILQDAQTGALPNVFTAVERRAKALRIYSEDDADKPRRRE